MSRRTSRRGCDAWERSGWERHGCFILKKNVEKRALPHDPGLFPHTDTSQNMTLFPSTFSKITHTYYFPPRHISSRRISYSALYSDPNIGRIWSKNFGIRIRIRPQCMWSPPHNNPYPFFPQSYNTTPTQLNFTLFLRLIFCCFFFVRLISISTPLRFS